MADRVILHCDLNNFFASVSLLSHPSLYSLPVAVCGDKEERHGIILAKNELAKSYGVKTAEVIFEAKAKCPDLVLLKPDYEKYREYSAAAYNIYSKYTDMIEPFGIDECWLDVTGSRLLFGDGETIAHSIRKEIKSQLGITVSVGVSFNKAFAKLGSDMKKPDAVTVISKENFKDKVWPLPVSDLLFAGKRTCDRLADCGILKIGDLAACSDGTLKHLLGKNGEQLKKYALGLDDSPVAHQNDIYIPKSAGRSVTRAKDFTSRDEVLKTFTELAEDISDTLRKYSLLAGGVQVHIRTAALNLREFSQALERPTNSSTLLVKKGMELFDKNVFFDQPLRSVGLRAINLKDGDIAIQQDFFGALESDEKQEKIDDSVWAVKKKFGRDSLKTARTVKKDN